MTEKKSGKAAAASLRRRAELKLAENPSTTKLDETETRRLLHELQVHQVELEMQNEELLLEQSRLRLAASVFANCSEGIMITDGNRSIIDVNPAFTQITGFQREEVIGNTPKILSSGRQDQTFYSDLWESLKTHGHWRGEMWNRRKTGEVYAEMQSISTIRDEDGGLQHYVSVFTDISQIKRHEEELDHIAHYDILTGIPNRRLLVDRLSQAVARARRSGKPLAVCYLDLDGFKPINDRYGHNAGDMLLIKITNRLLSILRADDTLARLGGDEFVLLLTDLPRMDECHLILDRVLAEVSAPTSIGSATVNISASIGVTLFAPLDDADSDALLRHADQAMFIAKQEGKNRYHFYDPLQDLQIQTHRHQFQRLVEALDNHEFVLFYQPKADLVSGKIQGAEALIRWQHPEEGLLQPGSFLHHMEGSDLETNLGEWVIETALQQMETWQTEGLDIDVSVNICASHLLQANFSQRLAQMLGSHPTVAPHQLELEILETAALSNMNQAVEALTSCRKLGVRFALDDFGTGYSSLAYFRNLPVDILKIDQSFVRNMLNDPNDLSIVEGVIRLASAFNRPVIAEGVETMDHGAMLVSIGCHLAQGYGIARPMPAAQMASWVKKWYREALWGTIGKGITVSRDFPLTTAAHSHRQWVNHLAEHLDKLDAAALIELEPPECRFGTWYHGEGASRYKHLPEFQIIGTIHDQMHALGAEMKRLADTGLIAKARDKLHELYSLRDELLASINQLIDKTVGTTTG
ncbi:MAG TPA: EAL domain-containing protein [Rhodocyclaceae bacterium]|jgi:diguanylate cyclase (GGDEF)-like protein/PAS domain S-box-containing protein